MILKIIAAVGQNLELGKKNGLIWNLPGDLKYFSENTRGSTVIMGENTFRSLPKMLPGRKHLVLTLEDNKFPEDVTVFHSLDKFLDTYKNHDEVVWVIGGGQIYKLFLPYAQELYLTEIQASDKTAEVYFPKFEPSEFIREVLGHGEDNTVKYDFVRYIRK